VDQRTTEKEIPDKALQYMVVSIPVDHPDAPLRDGLVRGQYESVEIVRQIKDWSIKDTSTDTLLNVAEPEKDSLSSDSTNDLGEKTGKLPNANLANDASDDHLVEWIMITRSDPGGGIPRFMVERGTPSSIAADAVKFLDWAISQTSSSIDSDAESAQIVVSPPEEQQVREIYRTQSITSDGSTFEPSNATDTGVIAALTSAVRDGLDKYAPGVPTTLSNMMPYSANNEDESSDEDDDDDDDSDTSSVNSFASALPWTSRPDEPEPTLSAKPSFGDHLQVPDAASSSVSSFESGKTTAGLEQKLSKLEEKRIALDSEYHKTNEKEEAKARDAMTKESKETDKIKDRVERDKRKREEKHAKELKKLEDKRRSAERKAEEKRRKAMDRDAMSQVKRERDQARRMAEVLRQENDILRDRVGELQRENTMIVQKISKLSGGRDLLREIKSLVSADPKEKRRDASDSQSTPARARSLSPTMSVKSSGSSSNSASKASSITVNSAAG
jgi:Protein of unknown function (DUF3074)